MLLTRRLRRLITSTATRLTTLITPPPPVKKHIKIDDEERGTPHPYRPSHTRTPLIQTLKMLFLLLTLLLFLTALTAYTIYKPPNTLIKYLQARNPDVIFHLPLPDHRKVVALTIDDAPSQHTPALLSLLATHNASATFFIIGSQIPPAHTDPILTSILAGGNELGNHAQHDEPSISLPLPELVSQIKTIDALLPPNASGNKYFRPGSGFFNAKMVERVQELGYRMVLGSVYPHDAQIRSARRNARHVVGGVRPGSVVIMHDRRGYSVEQLGMILEGLGRRGFEVVCLGELMRIKGEVEGEGRR
ncbi:hypothetical protein HYFRA_00010703 [Hymenoscyphus fraxineus]|uniref:chitin deacetylase n=1 Tax=Hymenoscyphus fraxineus TaxID=746836 RepID=A0A9N9KZF2_9HELO|nr:hypothetical protein HYFRA_00010703 [Hymenoscyphus fraxineus]